MDWVCLNPESSKRALNIHARHERPLMLSLIHTHYPPPPHTPPAPTQGQAFPVWISSQHKQLFQSNTAPRRPDQRTKLGRNSFPRHSYCPPPPLLLDGLIFLLWLSLPPEPALLQTAQNSRRQRTNQSEATSRRFHSQLLLKNPAWGVFIPKSSDSKP